MPFEEIIGVFGQKSSEILEFIFSMKISTCCMVWIKDVFSIEFGVKFFQVHKQMKKIKKLVFDCEASQSYTWVRSSSDICSFLSLEQMLFQILICLEQIMCQILFCIWNKYCSKLCLFYFVFGTNVVSNVFALIFGTNILPIRVQTCFSIEDCLALLLKQKSSKTTSLQFGRNVLLNLVSSYCNTESSILGVANSE